MTRETPKERKERLARQRVPYDRKHNEKRRRAAGMKPQSESNAQRKPWLADGVSRATWYRRRKNNGANEEGVMADGKPDYAREAEAAMEKTRLQREPFHQACRDLSEMGYSIVSLAHACQRLGLGDAAQELYGYASESRRLVKAFTDYDATTVNDRLKDANAMTGTMLSAMLHNTVGEKDGGS